jgi:hypothetical protein
MLQDFVRDADSGVTLYIQHDSAGKDKEPKWLPAPKGHSLWLCVFTGPRRRL